MSDAGHVRDDLSALLDGALPADRRAAVDDHLARCAACRAERARLAAALAALGALPPPPEPSPWFSARLAARLAAERRPGPFARLRGGRWWLVAAPSGALALAALVAVAGLRARAHQAEELAIAGDLGLLRDYAAVAAIDDLGSDEDVEVVAALDRVDRTEAAP